MSRTSSEEQHSFMGFRRHKKAPEQEKKDIDIAAALPSTDDFRTSLLMTGLSARFSMLREQDDPTTKIGKALDDSVLFPKRQSRLMDFSFRGLDDIAEVESIRAPHSFLRSNSYASDTDSMQDSIMNRTRPTEGNNLFGGRQKIYRIPAGATSAKNVSEGGMGGRALYESDVALSAFQKLRQEKRERFLEYGDQDDDERDTSSGTITNGKSLLTADIYESSGYPRSDSPSPVDYNLRRETSSTTSSAAGGGGRNSSAATSITSQGMSSKDWQSPQLQTQASMQSVGAGSGRTTPVERAATTRVRRLYEQGLNQDMHEHQSSALSRIDTLSGKRMVLSKTTSDLASTPPPSGHSAGTVASSIDRLERRQGLSKSSTTNLRSMSPPMSGLSVGSPSVPSAAGAAANSPPLSPPVSDSGVSALPIQPNDVGKATAMGMFQKPTLPYDESRFAERQLQLQQGREATINRSRSASEVTQTMGAVPTSSNLSTPPTVSTPVFSLSKLPSHVGSEGAKAHRTFLFDDDDDEDEEEGAGSVQRPSIPRAPQVSIQRPSDAEHPAFRQSALPTPLSLSPAKSTEDLVPSIQEEQDLPVVQFPADKSDEPSQPVDSPTLGDSGGAGGASANGGSGLTGLVLQHLRSTSNASSVYSTVSPQNSGFDGLVSPTADFAAANNGDNDLGLKIGQPWDEQDWTASVYSTISGIGGPDKRQAAGAHTETTAVPPLPQLPVPEPELPSRPPPPPSQKIAPQRPPIPETPKSMAMDAESSGAPSLRSVSSRSRLPSVADSTRSNSNSLDHNDEEDDFASQLANARRRVQERLTTYVESDTSSRNTSPLLAPTEPPTQPPPMKSNPLGGLLRAKSSRGSLLERSREPSQSKGMKVLGIGAATMSTSPLPTKQSFDDVPAASTPIAAAPAPDRFDFDALKEEREERKRVGREGLFGGRAPASTASTATTEHSPAPASSFNSMPRSSTDDTDTDGVADEEVAADSDRAPVPSAEDDEANMHPGLRAFRNARRELQKRKELEVLTRHQEQQPAAPQRERRGTQSSAATPPSRDRKLPPVYYQQRNPSEESRDGGSNSNSNGNQSRSDSRTSGQTERDRSGSDTSNSGTGNNGYARRAPPRLRNNNNQAGYGYDDYQQPHSQGGHGGGPGGPGGSSGASGGHLGPPSRAGGMSPMRSPGLPGTDIRRSPYMPPQGPPGGRPMGSSPAGSNLSVQTAMNGRSPGGNAYSGSAGLPSPISPLGSAGLPMSPYYYQGSTNGSGPSTPTAASSRMQHQAPPPPPFMGPGYNNTVASTLNDSMKKTVRKNEISEPTFIMSTSRVPTVSLPQSASAPDMANGDMNGSGTRSRSGSRARAGSNAAMAGFVPPPLPPINPMRKQPTQARGPRGMLGGFMSRRGGGDGGDEMDTMSALRSPLLSTSASSSNLSASANSNYQFGGGSASDTEDARLEQRMLRKQASEASGMNARMMGGGMQAVPRMDLPGGMI